MPQGESGWTRVAAVAAGREVVAWRLGDGAVPAFFFHGLLPAASGRIGLELAEQLVRLCRVRLYGVDAPGFGESAPPSTEAGYDLDLLARGLAAVVNQLDDGPVVLLGHSWGAAIACRVAAMLRLRPRGLVLLDGGHFDHADLPEADPSETVDDVRQQMAGQGWALEEETVEACVARVAGPRARARDGRGLREAVRAGLVETATGLRSRVSLEHAAAAMWALMNSRSSATYPALAQAHVPVLLLVATQPEARAALNRERLVAFRSRIPDLTVVEVPSGHDIPIDAPDAAAQEISRWLVARGIAAPGGPARASGTAGQAG